MRRAFTGWVSRWAARRHGTDTRPHTIHRRRIYIVPTRFGLMLSALLIAMLIAGLNYGSNLALAFTFLMASLAIVAMHHCHRNLLGLNVDADADADGFAQGSAALRFRIDNPSSFDRFDLEIRCAEAEPQVFAVGATTGRLLELDLPTLDRGIVRLPRWELRTRHPFGWFRAWTYVHTPIDVFVAPVPRGTLDLRAAGGTIAGDRHEMNAEGDEEFAGLRAYQPGDALKLMAWKVIARGQDPAVRHYDGRQSEPEWLDWNALAGLDAEARMQQLCRWVLDADSRGRRFGLRLPDLTLPPARGPDHRRACLRALASR